MSHSYRQKKLGITSHLLDSSILTRTIPNNHTSANTPQNTKMESNNAGQDKPIGIPTQDFSKDAPSTGAVKPKAMDAQGAVGKQFEGKHFARLVRRVCLTMLTKDNQNHSRRSHWFNRPGRWRPLGRGRDDWKAVHQGRRHRRHYPEQHGWYQEGIMECEDWALSVH